METTPFGMRGTLTAFVFAASWAPGLSTKSANFTEATVTGNPS